MNGLVLEAAIERLGAPARTMSALNMPQVCETYDAGQALRHFEENRIVVFAGGTAIHSSPPTRRPCCAPPRWNATPSSRRPTSDGVYSADPKKDPTAKRYDRISLQQAFDQDLKVLDATAFAPCPRKRYAYHCVLYRDAGRHRSGSARQGPRHRRRRLIDLARRPRRYSDAVECSRAGSGRGKWPTMTSTNSSAGCRAR